MDLRRNPLTAFLFSIGNDSDDGYVLLTALVFMAILFTVSVGLISFTNQYATSEKRSVGGAQALQLAEAGIDKAVYQLNQNPSYSGETLSLPGGTVVISISSIDSNNKRVTATGYVPNQSSPISTRTVKATASLGTSAVSFHYGVQVGEGGVSMSNGSIINGNLFSNGSISGNGTVTGDVIVAGGGSPTPDQQWTTQNMDWNLGDVSSRANAAQSFQPSVSKIISKVSLYVKKVGSPSDITIKIVSDNSGKPSKTVLASGTLRASNVTGTYGFVDASLSSNPTLTSGTTYWIIAIATVNASNYFIWGADSGSGYTIGNGMYSTDWSAATPVWNNVGGDFDFMTYMGGATTTLSGITVNGNAYANTLSSCSVGKDAYYQSISSCPVAGTSHPGSTDQSPQSASVSDAQIASWQANAAAGGTIGSQTIDSATASLGPKKINGNLTVQNSALLNVTGVIWVTGTVNFNNNATIRLDPSYGSNSGVIVTDSIPTLSNNVIFNGSGQSGSYLMFLVSKNAPTQQVLTINNNVTGAIFTAPHGRVSFLNNAVAKEVTGYGFDMNNNATITYDGGLANMNFYSGPGGSYSIARGSYVIVQ